MNFDGIINPFLRPAGAQNWLFWLEARPGSLGVGSDSGEEGQVSNDVLEEDLSDKEVPRLAA